MAVPDQTKDLGTALPTHLNTGASTGTEIDGALAPDTANIDPALLAGIDMNDPAIATAIAGWNGRNTSNAFTGLPAPTAPTILSGSSPTPGTPPPASAAPVAPAAPPDLTSDGTHDPITAAFLAEQGQAPASDPALSGAPVSTPTPDPTPAPLPTPDAPAGARVMINGQAVDVDAQTLQGWAALAGWSAQLPEHVRQAYAGIDSGELVAVSRAELQQLLARTQNPGIAPAPAPAPAYVDPYADPASSAPTHDALAAIQAQLQQLQAQVADAPLTAQAAARQTFLEAQRTNAQEQLAEQTAADFAASHALTPQQLDALTGYIVQTNLVGQLAAQRTVVGPAGQVLVTPEPGDLFRAAYEHAHQTISGFAGAAASTQVETQLAAAQRQQAQVDRKKDAQGAAASTPVAAIVLPERHVGPMSQNDMQGAIGEYLENLFRTDPQAAER